MDVGSKSNAFIGDGFSIDMSEMSESPDESRNSIGVSDIRKGVGVVKVVVEAFG
jgi:hypothetical protein